MEGRRIQVRLGRWSRRIPLGYVLSGGLLIAMGALTLVLAVTGTGMSSTGWQLRISADIQHAASWVTRQLSWLPGWTVVVLLLAVALVLIFTARRRGQASGHRSCCDSENTESHPAEVTTDES